LTNKIIAENRHIYYILHTTNKNSKPCIKYRIREIEENDVEREIGGILEVLENLAPVGKLDRTTAHNIFRQIKSNPLHKIFVAIEEDEGKRGSNNQSWVIGTTTLLVEPKFIFGGARFGHIEDVAVRKGYERVGIGSKLVGHATESAAKMGCMKTVLYCSDDRMYFYKKLGYSYRDNCMEIQHTQEY
jgi:glucosamine-phosphate N-acetyltransferase